MKPNQRPVYFLFYNDLFLFPVYTKLINKCQYKAKILIFIVSLFQFTTHPSYFSNFIYFDFFGNLLIIHLLIYNLLSMNENT